MNIRRRIVVILAACLASVLCVAGGGTEPLSEIPAAQREALTKRLGAYVEAYRGRKWDRLYDLVSDTGKGGADRQTFIAAMKHEHGIDFAQMPDLLEFNPDRSEKSDDGFDVYGCGKARREGMMFNGISLRTEYSTWSSNARNNFSGAIDGRPLLAYSLLKQGFSSRRASSAMTRSSPNRVVVRDSLLRAYVAENS